MELNPFISGSQGNPSEDLRFFTNRVSETSAFERLLEVPAGQDIPILMFYGVGGIGKTWLSKKLQRDYANHLPSAYLSLDPKAGGTDSIDSAKRLINIRRQLGDALFCPRFDLAYTWLRYKQGAGEEPCFKGAGFLGNVWEFLTEVGNAAASDVPGSNIISWFFKKVTSAVSGKLSNTKWKDWLLSNIGQDDFLRLKNSLIDEIYSELANRLLNDLNENLPELENRQLRGVLFIDSMESLRTPQDSQTQIYNAQSWVLDLYHPQSPILLVLTGRDRLTWEESLNTSFANKSYLEQHLVGGLSEYDSRKFLSSCGVDDLDLQEAVLRVSQDQETSSPKGKSGYHSFSLGLCANTIGNLKYRGVLVEPDTFDMAPGDILKLARRFLKSLGTESRYEIWLKKLALTPRFDEHAAREVWGPHPGVGQDAAWKTLLSYSFVQPAEENGWWKLHTKMRDALEELQKKDLKEWTRYHEFWMDLWESRSDTDSDQFASLTWYHFWTLDPQQALDKWKVLSDKSRISLEMQEHAKLLHWWNQVDFHDLLIIPEVEMAPVYAEALVAQGNELRNSTIGNLGDNLKQAINCYEHALEVFTEEDYPEQWAKTQNSLGIVYRKLPNGDQAENLSLAIGCYESALRVCSETLFPQVWAMAQNNLGIVYGQLPGADRKSNLNQAIKYYKAALRVYLQKEYRYEWAHIHLNLGATYRIMPGKNFAKNLKRSIKCYQKALRVYSESKNPRSWAMAQNNLGIVYASLPDGDRKTNLERAIECYEAALRVRTEANLPQAWATTQMNLGIACKNISAEDEAGKMEFLNRAIECYQNSLRVFHEDIFPASWANVQFNLGNLYLKLSTEDEAEQIANVDSAVECLTAALRVYNRGENNQDWAMVHNSLGIAYAALSERSQGKSLKMAITCYEMALQVRTEEDYAHARAMTQINLASAHSDQARLENGSSQNSHAGWQIAEQNLLEALKLFEECGDEHHADGARGALDKLGQEKAEFNQKAPSHDN